MDAVRDFIRQMGWQRLAAMGAVALLLIGGLAAVANMQGKGPMGYLFTELDPAAAQEISAKLAAQNVPYQLSPDGSAILAPVDRLAELRMSLAGEKVGGKIGYEVLDAEAPFGLSAAREKMDQTRAIEGELARSIESLETVTRARVHLVMPERQLFATEPRPASAAVQLRTRGRLGAQQVDAIRYLVAASVPELAPERISIVDQNGTLLARAGDPGGAGASDERRMALQNQLRENVETLLASVVGDGRVRAEVAVELDPDELREEQAQFDPDGQVIAKTTSVESGESADENSALLGGAATVATQMPENRQTATPGDARKTQSTQRSEETTYDNSVTKRTRVRPSGGIRRLTVSVMVDGVGEGAAWKPRSPAEIQRLQRLVENAVGFDAQRGDRVIVDSLKFAAADAGAEEAGFNLPTGELFGLARLLLMGGMLLGGLWMIAKLMRDRLPVPQAALAGPAGAAGPSGPIDLTPQQPRQEALESAIDAERDAGHQRAVLARKASDLAAENPGEAATLIRQWMTA